MSALGGPSTEACQELSTVEQLRASLILHAKGAVLFPKIVILSIICKKEATRPIEEPINITQYNLI